MIEKSSNKYRLTVAVTFFTFPISLLRKLLSILSPPSLESIGSFILVCRYISPPLKATTTKSGRRGKKKKKKRVR